MKKLHEICKNEYSEDLVARVYPSINKIFQRAVASLSQSRTSNGLLLLVCFFLIDNFFYRNTFFVFDLIRINVCLFVSQEILQFYLDFGEVVLHDADPSLRTFFRLCLSRY